MNRRSLTLTAEYQCGPVAVRVVTDNARILRTLDQLLERVNDNNCEQEPALEVCIYDDVGPRANLAKATPGNYDSVHHLNSATYYYELKEVKYTVIAVDRRSVGYIWPLKKMATWRIAGDLPPRTILHFCILDPLSLIGPHIDMLVWHGAVIRCGKAASILFGSSGSGKSTLAYLLAQNASGGKIQHMSDDTFVLVNNVCGQTVFPIASGFGLSPALVRSNGGVIEQENVLQYGRNKVYLRRLERHVALPARLDTCLFLRRCSADDVSRLGTGFRKLSRFEFLSALLDSQTHISHPGAVAVLELASNVARSTSGYMVDYLTYPDATAVAHHLEKGGLD